MGSRFPAFEQRLRQDSNGCAEPLGRFGAFSEETMKHYFMNIIRRKSTYFLLGTVVLDLLALILYMQYGTSVFIPKLSSTEISILIVGTILPLAVVFSPWKLPYAALFAVNLAACFEYLASQASFIANVFVAIDGTTFPAAFYLIVVCTLAAAVLSLVAMALLKEPFEGKNMEGEQA